MKLAWMGMIDQAPRSIRGNIDIYLKNSSFTYNAVIVISYYKYAYLIEDAEHYPEIQLDPLVTKMELISDLNDLGVSFRTLEFPPCVYIVLTDPSDLVAFKLRWVNHIPETDS